MSCSPLGIRHPKHDRYSMPGTFETDLSRLFGWEGFDEQQARDTYTWEDFTHDLTRVTSLTIWEANSYRDALETVGIHPYDAYPVAAGIVTNSSPAQWLAWLVQKSWESLLKELPQAEPPESAP